MKTPQILFISRHCPFGQAYGGQLRTSHILRHVRGCGDVTLALFPFDHGQMDPGLLQAHGREFNLAGVYYFDVPRPRTLSGTIRRALDPYCAETERGKLSPADQQTVEDLIGRHDLIWFHGITVANNLGRREWRNAVMDIDDIPSRVTEAALDHAGNPGTRLALWHRKHVWRRRERALLERFGVVCVCSEADRLVLGGNERIHVIPNGFEPDAREVARNAGRFNRIGFIGTLEYEPNRDGLGWFVNHVWPRIRAANPRAELRLVGKGTDKAFPSADQGIAGLGWVEDSAAEIATWAATVVPIKVGGGTRIKIAEAFGRSCPLVSTAMGAYGYEIANGRECLLADSEDGFADACTRLLQDREFGARLAACARARFDQEWSWQSAGPKVHEALRVCERYAVSRTGAEPTRSGH